MRQGKAKQLRDFIKSHEMRYFVEHSDYSDQTHIKKAFKVEIDNNEYWVHFANGDRPEIKDERILLKTMDEAKAEARKWRERKKEETAQYKARMDDVAGFLNDFSWIDYYDWNNREMLPKGEPLAEAVRRAYMSMPSKERDDNNIYIRLLENYIKHGTIYTQALAFRKEHVVSVKYGEDRSVEVELTNGMTIIPKSSAVTNLIKVLFGGKLDSWSYEDVKAPAQ